MEHPPEDELVLQLRLGRYILNDAMLGIIHSEGVMLGLGEFTSAVEFPITVDLESGQAEGWFLRENRRFFLDLVRGEVVIEGRREALPTGFVELQFDDIYVDTEVLAKWFQLDLAIKYAQSRVIVDSRQPLPIEERLEREETQKRLRNNTGSKRAKYPRQELPYNFFSLPFFETSISSAYQGGGRDANGNKLDATRSTGYSAHLSGDLLYHSMDLSFAGNDQDDLSSARITLSRKDTESNLLWPLSLTEYSFGDVYTPALPLIARSTGGQGLVISNYPLGRSTTFDTTILRGNLPLGWEVELYRNESLHAIVKSNAEGRYEFVNLPLVVGLNLFRLVFYGPQGQRRVEVQRILVGAGQLPPGTVHYRIAANKQGVNTISVGEETDTTLYSRDQEDPQRYIGDFEMGINRALSMSLSAAEYPIDYSRRSYIGLGFRLTLLGALLRLDSAKEITSQGELDKDPTEQAAGEKDMKRTAYTGSLQTRLLGINFSLEQDRYFDFFSEKVLSSTEDPLIKRNKYRTDFSVPLWLVRSVNFSFDWQMDERASGYATGSIGNRLSTHFWGVSVSNAVNYNQIRQSSGDPWETTSASGASLLSSRFGNLSVRGQRSYTIIPKNQTTSYNLATEYRFSRNTRGRLAFNQQVVGEGSLSTTVGLSSSINSISVGFDGSYNSNDQYSVGLNLSFGLGYDSRSGDFAMSSRSGAASVRVFLDDNQNGIFDEGEKPLKGVEFTGKREVETDEEGLAFITGLGSNSPTNLAVNSSSLEDPYWRLTKPGVEIVPRPGRTAEVDFPVTTTGEVEGMVFLQRKDQTREASNVKIQLMGASGKLIDEVKSEFDGFFLFSLVPPGRYVVRVSPEQVKRLHLDQPPDHDLVIREEGSIASNIKFVLKRIAEMDPELKVKP